MISAKYKKQTGVALLAVMILVLAITIILANIFYRHQIDVSQAAVSLHTDQALLIALSGEGWAQELLIEDGKQSQGSPVDHYGEIWAQAMPLFPVEGGTLTGCISDLQSRNNLNNFSKYAVGNQLQDEINSSDQNGFAKTWLNLLMLLQIPDSPARVATITDWIDPDDNVLSSWGAEQADYESYNPPRIVANQPMTDMTELAAVSGYTVQEVQMLMPWITVLPGAGTSQLGASATTPININTASEELLLALGGFYGTQFVDTVAQGRPFSTIDALYDNLNTNLGLWDVSGSTGVGNGIGRANKIWPPDLINVWSSYFRVYLKAEIGEAEIEVTSIMHRVGGNLDVISRDISLVPAVLPVKKELSEVEKLFAGNGSEVESDGRYDTDNSIVQPACLMMES